MAGPTQADASFPIDSPPKSCLALLTVLQKLESLVEARIEWKASWPTVKPNPPAEIRVPFVVYKGSPTQSPEQAWQAECRARRNEFKKLKKTLPPDFTAIRLPAPSPSEFATGSDFWVQQAAIILAEAFNRNELIRGWIPEVPNGSSAVDPSANEKVYPPFPIRSLDDMELWLGRWIKRCALPDRPPPPIKRDSSRRVGRTVTVQVPSERPPFQSPVEIDWRCRLDDLARELRNCSRSFHVWGLPIDIDWEGDPPDFPTAEDRVIRVIKLLREYRQSVFNVLDKRCSVDEIGRMPVPELLAKLARASAHPSGQGKGAKKCKPKSTARKRGRPPGTTKSKLEMDKEIYDLWKRRNYKTKAEFARNLPSRFQSLSTDDVIKAIDRHRKEIQKNNLGKK